MRRPRRRGHHLIEIILNVPIGQLNIGLKPDFDVGKQRALPNQLVLQGLLCDAGIGQRLAVGRVRCEVLTLELFQQGRDFRRRWRRIAAVLQLAANQLLVYQTIGRGFLGGLSEIGLAPVEKRRDPDFAIHVEGGDHPVPNRNGNAVDNHRGGSQG